MLERSTHVTRAIKELQSENFALVSGELADTLLAVADMRIWDTIVKVLDNNSGVFSDETANCTIADLAATADVVVSTGVVGDSVTVDGLTFVAKTIGTTVLSNSLTGALPIGFSLGATDAATAENLAAAINSVVGRRGDNGFSATVDTATVTLKSNLQGTAGNGVVVTDNGGGLTASGNFAGGTDTGGILCTNATNEVHITWLKKPKGHDASG